MTTGAIVTEAGATAATGARTTKSKTTAATEKIAEAKNALNQLKTATVIPTITDAETVTATANQMATATPMILATAANRKLTAIQEAAIMTVRTQTTAKTKEIRLQKNLLKRRVNQRKSGTSSNGKNHNNKSLSFKAGAFV